MLKLLLLCLFLLTTKLVFCETPPTTPAPDCPDGIIIGNGNFPLGATKPTHFPIYYTCKIQLQIENGYCLHITALKTNETRNESVSVQYSNANYMFGADGDGNTIDTFAPSGDVTIIVDFNGYDGDILVSWEFQYVGNLTTTIYPIGHLMTITMETFKPITFTSNERIVARTVDPDMLMFDGPTLNSSCIDPNIGVPTGNSVTFVKYNSAGFNTGSRFLAIPYSAISNYSEWHLIDPDTGIYLVPRAAITVISNTTETFFSAVSIVMQYPDGVEDEAMGIELWKGTPGMGDMELVISYRNNTNYTNSSPQQILCTTYTIVSTGYLDNIAVNFKNDQWGNLFPGRTGSVISESIWETNGGVNYNETFESPNLVVITFHVSLLEMSTDEELLHIEIGDRSSTDAPRVFEFTKKTQELFTRSVIGNYMSVVYSGAQNISSSIFRVDFEIGEYSLPISTTSNTPETTTQSVSKVLTFTTFLISSLPLFVSI